MTPHLFLFQAGIWNGQGRISFNTSPEVVSFVTQWEVSKEEGGFRALQKVEMQGTEETLTNHLYFSHITSTAFEIELSNELLGTVKGKGIIDEQQIGWEFRGHATLEGFEVYRRIQQDEYTVHAEYASPDQYRTIITGRLWQKP